MVKSGISLLIGTLLSTLFVISAYPVSADIIKNYSNYKVVIPTVRSFRPLDENMPLRFYGINDYGLISAAGFRNFVWTVDGGLSSTNPDCNAATAGAFDYFNDACKRLLVNGVYNLKSDDQFSRVTNKGETVVKRRFFVQTEDGVAVVVQVYVQRQDGRVELLREVDPRPAGNGSAFVTVSDDYVVIQDVWRDQQSGAIVRNELEVIALEDSSRLQVPSLDGKEVLFIAIDSNKTLLVKERSQGEAYYKLRQWSVAKGWHTLALPKAEEGVNWTNCDSGSFGALNQSKVTNSRSEIVGGCAATLPDGKRISAPFLWSSTDKAPRRIPMPANKYYSDGSGGNVQCDRGYASVITDSGEILGTCTATTGFQRNYIYDRQQYMPFLWPASRGDKSYPIPEASDLSARPIDMNLEGTILMEIEVVKTRNWNLLTSRPATAIMYPKNLDSDKDGTYDKADNCPSISNPDQADLDGDSIGDACDPDVDGDSVENTLDNCPLVANSDQLDVDGDLIGDACDDLIDNDADGIANDLDNCPAVPNVDQADNDGDLQGDACDLDDDNDGVEDTVDNCSLTANEDQADNDSDNIGDVCDSDDDNDAIEDDLDNCPLIANVSQDDNDGDGFGDVCDPDDDNDAVNDSVDNCPLSFNPDQSNTDGVGAGDACNDAFDVDDDDWENDYDNCPDVANRNQSDYDSDNIGDACDSDVDGDEVANAVDACELTPLGELVGSIGCSIEQLCPCDAPRQSTDPWKNHGQYVSCMTKAAQSFAADGVISDNEKSDLVNAAAQSSCGY